MIGDGGHAQQVSAEYGNLNIIAIGDNATRRKIAGEEPEMPWDRAGCGKYVPGFQLGPGSVVLMGAVIGTHVTVKRHCIINHNAVVDHHAVLEDYVHVAPGACVLGGATVGEGALIGANAVVLPEAEVPAWAIVRAGSVYPCDYGEGGRELKFKTLESPEQSEGDSNTKGKKETKNGRRQGRKSGKGGVRKGKKAKRPSKGK